MIELPLDVDAVRAFVRIAELGSFTRAAEALRTTQGAVSLKLKRLEERLGCRLVERTPRYVHAEQARDHGGREASGGVRRQEQGEHVRDEQASCPASQVNASCREPQKPLRAGRIAALWLNRLSQCSRMKAVAKRRSAQVVGRRAQADGLIHSMPILQLLDLKLKPCNRTLPPFSPMLKRLLGEFWLLAEFDHLHTPNGCLRTRTNLAEHCV